MDAILTVDDEQRITLFNAAAERMFGCPARQAIGQPLDVFIPASMREAHRHHVRAFGQEGTTTRAMGHLRPLKAVRSNGEEFPIEASISVVEVDGRKLFTAIVRDVTARIEAERALQQAQARYRAIFDHAGLGIVMTSLEGAILEANPAMERMLGYGPGDLRGREYLRLVHPKSVGETLRHIEQLKAGEVEEYEVEKRYLRKDGSRLWGRVIGSNIRDAAGRIQYFIRTIEDITDRKRRAALRRRTRLAQAEGLRNLATLTPREREVLWLVVAGKPTKGIAAELGASPKTIEVHRARVMVKMRAHSIAELVRTALPLRAPEA